MQINQITDLAWLGFVVVYAVLATIKSLPIVKHKQTNQKMSNAVEAYTLLDKFAQNAVYAASVRYELTGDQKRAQVLNQVMKQLADHGQDLDEDNVLAAIEKAYQQYTIEDTKSAKEQAEFNDGVENAELVLVKQQTVQNQKNDEVKKDEPEPLDVPDTVVAPEEAK